MPRPRKVQVCRSDTPYYHCVSRCVRRAFLCGHDQATDVSYEHRREWVAERLHVLACVFAIEVCAYAVMSNHYHLVVKLGSSADLPDDEVVARWLTLFKGPHLIRSYQAGSVLSPLQRETISDIINVWRSRLQDLSWFMKCLNEPIARQANEEDNCTGHFWEARFKSQALLTQEALLSCMAYVDLNPIRAGLAVSPEESDYTSIQERITQKRKPAMYRDVVAAQESQTEPRALPVARLLHFKEAGENAPQTGIPFAFRDYLELVDWTGRQSRTDKRGAISHKLPPIITRLNIEPAQWLINSMRFEEVFHRRFRNAS